MKWQERKAGMGWNVYFGIKEFYGTHCYVESLKQVRCMYEQKTHIDLQWRVLKHSSSNSFGKHWNILSFRHKQSLKEEEKGTIHQADN